MLSAVARFVGTVAGKIVLGAAVVGAGVGGITVAGAIGGSGPEESRPAVVTDAPDVPAEADAPGDDDQGDEADAPGD